MLIHRKSQKFYELQEEANKSYLDMFAQKTLTLAELVRGESLIGWAELTFITKLNVQIFSIFKHY